MKRFMCTIPMIRFSACLPPLSLGLLLSACATPQPVVHSIGALPGTGSYAFGEGGALPPTIAQPLSEHLARQGLIAADNPTYLVQAEYSRAPIRTGTLVADQADPKWLRAPGKGGGKLSHVSVSVTEVASGTEVYRSTAWQPVRGKADDGAQLMQAALNPPPALAR